MVGVPMLRPESFSRSFPKKQHDQIRKSDVIKHTRKGNCLDNACTEGLFGHMKDEFFRGRDWDDFESFKEELEAYMVHWNTRRRQKGLKGLTPEEFRSQSLMAV